MPELPEIEILARDLRRTIVGKTIVDVHAGQPKALNMPLDEMREKARGAVHDVERHGKAALLRLPSGALRLHMGLGGTVQLLPAMIWPAAKFFGLLFADEWQLAVDKSFMGHAHFLPAGEERASGAVGMDVLDPVCTVPRFIALLRAKPKVAVKAALMDQALLAGVGNTYSDEALLGARLHPARPLASIGDEELARLYEALRAVLEGAIAAGGEPDWRDLQGQPGRYRMLVHAAGRCGECGGPVETITIGGRTGYLCPACQPAR
jgi:formamidopyrimidine-DNA glycosylase